MALRTERRERKSKAAKARGERKVSRGRGKKTSKGKRKQTDEDDEEKKRTERGKKEEKKEEGPRERENNHYLKGQKSGENNRPPSVLLGCIYTSACSKEQTLERNPKNLSVLQQRKDEEKEEGNTARGFLSLFFSFYI